jgi:hypothetical protein
MYGMKRTTSGSSMIGPTSMQRKTRPERFGSLRQNYSDRKRNGHEVDDVFAGAAADERSR